jgi:tRNA pseudouridine13 synthase
VRSAFFNGVLSERVQRRNWDCLIDGDIAQLSGSRALFPCAMPDPELARRCAGFDIHPTGPMPGGGGMQPARDAADLEQEVLLPHAEVVSALERARVESARRSLRLRPEGLEWAWSGADLELQFTLTAGAYATSVLRELVSLRDDSISESI